MNFSELQRKIDYRFRDERLLKEALTHRSYLNENPSWGVPHNERLEFLGDAALELAVTEGLYHRYPNYEEGTMTAFRAALVNFVMLARIAREMELEQFILLSRGEAKDNGRSREVILANAFEAVVGAVYLDAGHEAVKRFTEQFVFPRLDEVVKKGLYKDPKSELQEKVQAEKKVTPSYKVIKEEGPDHDKRFTVCVYFGDQCVVEGEGPSKQEAEAAAAANALALLK